MNGITVVTGAPRCGTSLMMQTLSYLGVPIVAPAFLKEHAQVIDFNPGGFYELDMNDGADERFMGKAVKLFGGQLWMTPKDLVSKIIWVQRNKQQAVASYEMIRKKLPRTSGSSEAIYDANIRCIKESIKEFPLSVFIVKLEEVKTYPSLFITDLVKYLQISPSAEQINLAYNNIKKSK